MLSRILFACLLGVSGLNAAASTPDSPRARLPLSEGWKFHMGDAPDAAGQFDYPEVRNLAKTEADDAAQEAALAAKRAPVTPQTGARVSFAQPGFDDGAWRTLSIPHDWVSEQGFVEDDGVVWKKKPGSWAHVTHGSRAFGPRWNNTVGWYRKTFEVPASDKGRALWLEFDGIHRNALIWLNGRCLGRNVSGTMGNVYDITDQVNYGGRNTLAVRADASRHEGWYYEGAGIYRPVWLTQTGPAHVVPWGVWVRPVLSDDLKTASVSADIRVDARRLPAKEAPPVLSAALLDPDGRILAQQRVPVEKTPTISCVSVSFPAFSPRVWDVKTPVLYTLRTQVESPDGRVLDACDTPFGIRRAQFTPQGFFLNNRRVEIKGVCMHQDHAGVGTAIPPALHRWRLAQIQKMGANAVRLAHNPFDPAVLDMCDRMGLLVLSETRRPGDTPELLGQLERMITRDRNHPSIILWGLGNEEKALQNDDAVFERYGLPAFALARRLDPDRPLTFGDNTGAGNAVSAAVDVQGYNYFLTMANYEAEGKGLTPDAFHEKFPNKPVILTEDGSNLWMRGHYQHEPEKNALSAYDVPNPSRHWIPTLQCLFTFLDARPWIAGVFVWTAFDYRGEPEFRWPSVGSFFGAMDACGFPKDAFYYYQALWSEEPVMHVFPHWNWKPGAREIPLQVFTNLDEVSLEYNGVDYGRRKVNRGQPAEWRLHYAPGRLVVRGYRAGQCVQTQVLETTGAPARLALSADRAAYAADGLDTAVLRVSALDAQGRLVPDASNLVRFEIQGPARLIGTGNGDPNGHEGEKAPQRRLFSGLAQLLVQSDGGSGSVTVRAFSDGLEGASVTLSFGNSADNPKKP